MKMIKPFLSFSALGAMLFGFSQCSSSKSLEKASPMEFGEVYCQEWAGGIQSAGTGINIFIDAGAISKNTVQLDSVYFRGKGTKLEIKDFDGKRTYVGRFNPKKTSSELVLSNDPKEEYGNKIELQKEAPFKLEDNECVISYLEGEITKYYKLTGVKEKPRVNFPSAGQNLP